MNLFPKVLRIPFMSHARVVSTVSGVLMVICLGSILFRGLNFGIDFTGGVLLEVGYPQTADLGAIRKQLDAAGFPDAQVQNVGSTRDVMIRLPPVEDSATGDAGGKLGQAILAALRQDGTAVDLRRVEFVGPQVGRDLTEMGTLSVLAALALILVYVLLRFQWKFAVGAVLATFHDAVVTVGLFSIFWIPFDLSVVAAVLALVGYSLNDTVVVFDRIRDDFRVVRGATPVEMIDHAINVTLSRTVITSGVTLLVVIALLAFGGEALRGFSLALAIGIVFGSYSSVYVASAIAYFLDVKPADLVPQKKAGPADEMP
ncbi:MAG: protein translocase subunit SecF [Gammaproteobacteria bacterium]|nr:protein translocase subunit SecF [Gammaproteobacteria bacterium]